MNNHWRNDLTKVSKKVSEYYAFYDVCFSHLQILSNKRGGNMNTETTLQTDIVVVGAGNAALCAAIAAREQGKDVIVLEKAPKKEMGGNSYYTHGSIRFAYRNEEDIKSIIPDLSEEQLSMTDFGSYPAEQFYDDLITLTEYKTDPELASVLADQSFATMKWLVSHNVRFVPIYGRQAFKIDGKFKFWGGMIVEAVGGGPGLVAQLYTAAKNLGISFYFNAMATKLLHDDRGVYGVVYKQNGQTKTIHAQAVILASGGFHANTEMRARYLGEKWDVATVRGSRYNTGDGIRMALEIGAMPHGHWSGAHAVCIDLNARDFQPDGQLLSFPFGIMVNAHGERFVDEGADFRNYTYAKIGKLILEQPGQLAWQIFDRKTLHLLRDEYKGRTVTKVRANSLEELARKLTGVEPEGFLRTVKEFNAAVQTDIPFNPNIKDGRGTKGLRIPKTNWAQPIDEPPFEAYGVTCGITFTYGGLKINTRCEVHDLLNQPIPGLYAAGELVGGLFYFNYPGGAGLMAGSVFGKIAGEQAAKFATKRLAYQ